MFLLATMMIFFVDSRLTIRAMAFGCSGGEMDVDDVEREAKNKINISTADVDETQAVVSTCKAPRATTSRQAVVHAKKTL